MEALLREKEWARSLEQPKHRFAGGENHFPPRSCAVFGVRKPLAFSVTTSASQFFFNLRVVGDCPAVKEVETNGTGQTDNLMQV